MQCPLCGDQALEPHFRLGIEIDVCPNCKGVWLDRGELDRLAAEPPAQQPDLAAYAPTPAGAAPRPAPLHDDRTDRRPPAPRDDRDRDWDRERDRDWDRERDRDRERDESKKKRKKKKPKSKRLSDALEDLFDDILDF